MLQPDVKKPNRFKLWQWWAIFGPIAAWLLVSSLLLGEEHSLGDLLIAGVLMLMIDAVVMWRARHGADAREDLAKEFEDFWQ